MNEETETLIERIDQEIREYRDKNFAVDVEPIPENRRVYEDEVLLRTTQNGRQWFSIALNKEEARQVVAALKEYFSIV